MVTRTKKIFVGGLSAPSTLEDVKNYFEQFGRVSWIWLIKLLVLTLSRLHQKMVKIKVTLVKMTAWQLTRQLLAFCKIEKQKILGFQRVYGGKLCHTLFLKELSQVVGICSLLVYDLWKFLWRFFTDLKRYEQRRQESEAGLRSKTYPINFHYFIGLTYFSLHCTYVKEMERKECSKFFVQ